MRTRLLLLFAFAAATVLMNVASAGNIAHGVEVVVIDAGHGGKFPGAHYGGVYEKDLTLKVALKLGKLVEEGMPGVKVVYTRTADRTLGADLAADLQARADIANKAGGDLFISIHANAAPRATGVRGVETLIMGESSKEQRYNENALFENNREDLIDMSDERTAAVAVFPSAGCAAAVFSADFAAGFSTLFSAAFPADFSAGCSAAGFAAAACSSSAIRVPST